MGSYSGASCTTGDGNIFIGHQAGNSSSTNTGNDNIIMGGRWNSQNAGGNLTSGYTNIMIGNAVGAWGVGDEECL